MTALLLLNPAAIRLRREAYGHCWCVRGARSMPLSAHARPALFLNGKCKKCKAKSRATAASFRLPTRSRSRTSNQSPVGNSAKREFLRKRVETFGTNWEFWFESGNLGERRAPKKPRIYGL